VKKPEKNAYGSVRPYTRHSAACPHADALGHVFIETLALAAESGTTFNGVLCGRATWPDGMKIYAQKGAKAFEEWLNTQGVENIQNVNKALEAAHPWTEKVDLTPLEAPTYTHA
jgi:tagatose-1,6-bisphosphate aldolase